jgi:hypothetical protein
MNILNNIVYISGSGRSGSTLLERILHSSAGVSALGEFHCLWRLPASEITCSCTKPFANDIFWRDVLCDAGIDARIIEELRTLEQRVCRTSFIIRHRFSLKRLAAEPSVKRFLEIQFAIFEAIARASGSATLVDSSKAGPRAWIMACDPRVRILHLYRDPADVIASWRSVKFDKGMDREMMKMSVANAAGDWWKVEQLIRILGKQRPVVSMKYEALCGSPMGNIADSLARLQLEHTIAPDWINSNAVQQGLDYHSLNGNPDRFAVGPIEISHRKPDWAAMAPKERMTIRTTASAIRAMYPF